MAQKQTSKPDSRPGSGGDQDAEFADKAALAAAIADASLLRGTFTLRSGRTSSYYLDKYLFSTRPEILEAVGDLLGDAIDAIEEDLASAGKPGISRLAGAELGGIPLVTVAGLVTGLPTIFIRNQKKDYGTAKRLEGVVEKGDRVLIIEDVATSGGQAIEAAKTLRETGAEVVGVIVTIDRQEGAREAVEAEGLRFEALFTKADLGIDE